MSRMQSIGGQFKSRKACVTEMIWNPPVVLKPEGKISFVITVLHDSLNSLVKVWYIHVLH